MTATLRRIPAEDARLGMFIQRFEGPWMSHPFWRRRFLLTDPCDLAILHNCEVDIVIDEARGLRHTPAPPPAPRAAPVPPAPARSATTRWQPPTPTEATALYHKAEQEAAKQVVDQSKRALREMFRNVRLGKALNPQAIGSVVEAITASVERNPHALLGVSRLKNKDEYTYLHSVAVCALMVNLARHLDLPDATIRRLGLAGLLHDVGKMAVSDTILNKPDRLTEEEFRAVRNHPQQGHALLTNGCDIPDEALDVCLHHHEKVDGTGYPFGLSGADLSLHARMGAICDVYDALTSNRSYKKGWTPSHAVTAMHGWSGHFDADLLFRFFKSIGIFPVGLLVRMRTNRLAIVLDNGRRATRQRVRAFYSISDGELLERSVDLELSDTLAGDQIVSAERPEAWPLLDWNRLCAELTGDAPVFVDD